MKRRGFTIPGFKYREWEQGGKAYVLALEGVQASNIERTIETINEVISEFNLPLEILDGSAIAREDTLLGQKHNCQQHPRAFD
jgi:hypothetical protein